MGWTDLNCADLKERWHRNVAALASRNPQLTERVSKLTPAVEYAVSRSATGDIAIASNGASIAERVGKASATEIIRKLFPGGKCTEPLLIAGLDRGWLWSAAYAAECSTPRAPGHRPPLYFLAADVERLWVSLHLHDWTTLLADPRVRLFAGPDAAAQCGHAMRTSPEIPWAKLSVTVDPALWPTNVTIDTLWQDAQRDSNARMQLLLARIDAHYANTDRETLVHKLRNEKLRVLGITSHYTTFLKHSMRDWLDAFEQMGHTTRLAIESAAHQIANPLFLAEQVEQFQPDLLLMIDHFRAEIPGLPRQIPCVMWVQDYLPNMFNPAAGAAQGPLDYCLGFGRLELKDKFGYPEQRFMPAQVGVNERRFAPRELSASERAQFSCDVSFVSHASTPATALLSEQLKSADATGRKLLIDVFEQLRAVYDGGKAIAHAKLIERTIHASSSRLQLSLDKTTSRQLLDFFTHKINNALFRHQAIGWAADAGVHLKLYGRGWENHPRFRKFAGGIACNESQLSAIYQASKINLQITPFGAVHQRLLEGLSAGGFFLIRQTAGDLNERFYQPLHEWCVAHAITCDEQLRESSSPSVRQLLGHLRENNGVDPFDLGASLIEVLKLSADGGYIRSASTVWKEFDRVTFDSAEACQAAIQTYLADENLRVHMAHSMRQTALDRFTYRSTSQRLLRFIANNLTSAAVSHREAA